MHLKCPHKTLNSQAPYLNQAVSESNMESSPKTIVKVTLNIPAQLTKFLVNLDRRQSNNKVITIDTKVENQ